MTLLLLTSFASAEFDHVSLDKAKRLTETFANAHLRDQDRSVLTRAKEWSCEMYGTHHRQTVEHKVALYAFATDSGERWTNAGAMPIRSYEVKNDALDGRSQSGLSNQIRVTSDGKLIARLSQSPKNEVLGYALCDPL